MLRLLPLQPLLQLPLPPPLQQPQLPPRQQLQRFELSFLRPHQLILQTLAGQIPEVVHRHHPKHQVLGLQQALQVQS